MTLRPVLYWLRVNDGFDAAGVLFVGERLEGGVDVFQGEVMRDKGVLEGLHDDGCAQQERTKQCEAIAVEVLAFEIGVRPEYVGSRPTGSAQRAAQENGHNYRNSPSGTDLHRIVDNIMRDARKVRSLVYPVTAQDEPTTGQPDAPDFGQCSSRPYPLRCPRDRR